jgi:hypothetical protein
VKNFLADKVQELQATVVQQQKGFQSKLEAQEKQIAALHRVFEKLMCGLS